MNVEEEYLSLQEHCRNKILKSVYIMTGVLFGMEILIYVLMKAFHTGMVENDLNYILFYILTPSLINVGCVLGVHGAEEESGAYFLYSLHLSCNRHLSWSFPDDLLYLCDTDYRIHYV